MRPSGEAVEVGESGTVAGVIDQPWVTEVPLRLEPGDLVVGYTDGISERGGDGVYFDDSLPKAVAGLAGLPAQQAADALRRASEDFAPTPPNDDMAVMVLRYLGRQR